MKSYHIILKREKLIRDIYAAGIVQGLIYGLCSIPCETELWDVEQFSDFYSYCVECAEECIDKFNDFMDIAFPGMYEIHEIR